MAEEALAVESTTEASEPPKTLWVEILAVTISQVNIKLDYFEPLVINGKPMVAPPEEVRSEGSIHMKNSSGKWIYLLHVLGGRRYECCLGAGTLVYSWAVPSAKKVGEKSKLVC